MHLAFKAPFLFAFAYRIFNGFISPAYTDFSSVFSVSSGTHWLTHMRQTSTNTRSFFIPSFSQLPMLYSKSLLYFFSLLILKHAEFLLRPIDLYPRYNCLPRKVFRASHLRCAPGHLYCWAILTYNCKTAIGVSNKSKVLYSHKVATANNEWWRSFSGFVSVHNIDFSTKLQRFA